MIEKLKSKKKYQLYDNIDLAKKVGIKCETGTIEYFNSEDVSFKKEINFDKKKMTENYTACL